MASRDVFAHLLRRATFGPTAAEVDAAERAGYDATLNMLLRPGTPDAGAVRTPVPVLGIDPYHALPNNPTRPQQEAAGQQRKDLTRQITEWWLDRMVAAEHGLVEKLVFFWHGHWATSVSKVAPGLMLRQQEVFRRHGRGDFAVMVRAMVRDPAMILWLDGHRNTAAAPNENLARELMELFTLGIGNYTEQDVKEGARALTGWAYNTRTTVVAVNPRRYDAGDKTILGVTAPHDADSYVDILMAQPKHPEFITGRLWARYASDVPAPESTRARLVDAYRSDGRSIASVLRALFTDPAFARSAGHLAKQPIEWLIGAMRQLGVRPGALSKDGRRQLTSGLDRLDQVPFRPPSVGGWPAGPAWLTVASVQARLRVADFLAGQADRAVIDRLAATPVPGRPDALARLLVVDQWTDRTRGVLNAAAREPRRLVQLGLSSPEYAVH